MRRAHRSRRRRLRAPAATSPEPGPRRPVWAEEGAASNGVDCDSHGPRHYGFAFHRWCNLAVASGKVPAAVGATLLRRSRSVRPCREQALQVVRGLPKGCSSPSSAIPRWSLARRHRSGRIGEGGGQRAGGAATGITVGTRGVGQCEPQRRTSSSRTARLKIAATQVRRGASVDAHALQGKTRNYPSRGRIGERGLRDP